MNYKIINDESINLSHCALSTNDLLHAIENTNSKLEYIHDRTSALDLDIFKVIDFRVLSGLVGETLVIEINKICPFLVKNPNIDGYPDLIQVSSEEIQAYYKSCISKDFISYKHGGLEIKNTFGTKKSKSLLQLGDTRILDINKKLDWKAHHQNTNNLIAIFSDFIEGFPKIVTAFFCDNLNKTDWSDVQRPKEDSSMTSFSTITSSGYDKVKRGIKICIDDPKYLNFFSE